MHAQPLHNHLQQQQPSQELAVLLRSRGGTATPEAPPPPPPPLEPPPARLNTSRHFCFALLVLWSVCTMLLFFYSTSTMEMFQPPLRILEERDETVHDVLFFGLWDSKRALTPLQLQVGISLTLGTRTIDEDIRVVPLEDYFFEVSVQHGSVVELETVLSPQFVLSLNKNLVPFGGQVVLSRQPRLRK